MRGCFAAVDGLDLGGQEEAAVYDAKKGSDIAQQERNAPEDGAGKRVQRCEWRVQERVRAGEAHRVQR